MLIFDEKKYAQDLLKDKKFQTYRQKDIERYILIRYLASENKTMEEIKKTLTKFPLIGCEDLEQKEIDLIYERIIKKALSCELVTGIKVKIYKSEIEVINSLDNDNAKNLLFLLLVYYKWAISQSYLYFYSKHNNIEMVVTNDLDIWKQAGIMKLRISDRYRLCNELIKRNLYVEDNFKSYNYFYLPFLTNEGELAMEIENYDNIVGELSYYNDKDNYKRCELCNTVIKRTRSPKKYCIKCSKKEEKNKTKLRVEKLRKKKM